MHPSRQRRRGETDPMGYHMLRDFHVALAFAVFALSIGLSVGAWRLRRDRVLPIGFWRWQAVMQILVLILVASGATLYLLSFRPKDPLHFLYGILALLTIGLERGLMPGHGLRAVISQNYGRFHEVWIYFGLSIFLVLMFGRGITTGLWRF